MFNTRKDQFSVGFHNGWTFSATWMNGTYGTRHNAGTEDDEVTLVEAAAFRTDSRGGRPHDIVWFHFDKETAPAWVALADAVDVYGWLTPENVAEFMQIVANLDTDYVDPWEYTTRREDLFGEDPERMEHSS